MKYIIVPIVVSLVVISLWGLSGCKESIITVVSWVLMSFLTSFSFALVQTWREK